MKKESKSYQFTIPMLAAIVLLLLWLVDFILSAFDINKYYSIFYTIASLLLTSAIIFGFLKLATIHKLKFLKVISILALLGIILSLVQLLTISTFIYLLTLYFSVISVFLLGLAIFTIPGKIRGSGVILGVCFILDSIIHLLFAISPHSVPKAIIYLGPIIFISEIILFFQVSKAK